MGGEPLPKFNDVHVHINPFSQLTPDAFELMYSNQEFVNDWQRLEREPAYFVKKMDEEGVIRAVLINYVSLDITGYQRDINEFVYRYCKDFRDRLIPFGGVDFGLEMKEFMKMLEDAYSKYEVVGFKLHPVHQSIYPNQYLPEYGDKMVKTLEVFYEYCQDNSIPVTIHTGTSLFPRARVKYGDPLCLDDVIIDFPRLRVIMAHGGRPFWTEQAYFLLRRHKNLHLDLSGVPPSRLLEYFPRIKEISDKVMFGSDWPGPGVKGMRANAALIWNSNLDQETKIKILRTNFDAFFK
ncbi:MAG: amidohydrolase family protein [Aigarchaeota archaeon]|nr:amidohydrolase family protein [Aigarchaeota archaeon]MDW8092802.1 amidohydrolase family protein [Nitrososphaerota archaeon]